MPLEDYIGFDEPKFRNEKKYETIDTLLYIHHELTESNKKATLATGTSIALTYLTVGLGVVGALASAHMLAINCKKREIIHSILRERGCIFSVPGTNEHLVLISRPGESTTTITYSYQSILSLLKTD